MILAATASPVFAQKGMFFPCGSSDAPWHISAEELELDQTAKGYLAKGNVVIKREGATLSADLVRLNQETGKAWAEGNVVLASGEDVLTGSRLEIDFTNETGTIFDGSVFVSENHFYITGDKIQKTGENTYTARDASVTTCDGEKPAWKITGRKVDVTVEGYGYVYNAALWAKSVPVLYTPFLFFPVKNKRQSGLLPPELGYSDRKGAWIDLPLFAALSDHTDATVYANYMEKRGFKTGLEYRYMLGSQSKGAAMIDILDDRQTDDGRPDSTEKWGYEDDEPARPNSDRYWFRMKHDQALPFDYRARLDLDIAGDQDYLHEFREGPSGFDETREYFNKTFGREIDDYNDPVRVNSLAVSGNGPGRVLDAGVRWYDNIVERRWSDSDTTLHKLPYLNFNFLRQPVVGKSFYSKLDSEFVYFYRNDEVGRGSRIDISPEFSRPVRFGNYLTVEPSVGLRETLWILDAGGETDSTPHRETYNLRLNVFTDLHRTFNTDGDRLSVRHSARPSIVYEYVPDRDEDDFPYFDASDRIDKKHAVTFSINNWFDLGYPEKNGRGNGFCRLKLEQIYDIGEAGETEPSAWRNGREKRPFLPLYGELAVVPGRWVSVHADAEWSHYDGAFSSRNVRVDLSDNRGDRFFAEHRYSRDSAESVYLDLFIKISKKISLFADYERNLRDGEEIGSGLGFRYKAQCWSLEAGTVKEDDELAFSMMINLFGLGGIGG